MVPVLSITMPFTFLRASIEMPPLKSIPSFDAAPMPAKKARGTLMTSAHGQLITRKVMAVVIQKDHSPVMTEGMMAVRRAIITTTGVYILANLVMNLSILGLPAAAVSTELRMRVTMDSDKGRTTFILRTPWIFMQPEITSVPAAALTGTGSPVTGEVSILLSPSTTIPSRGILSPGRTRRISPGFASAAGITRMLSVCSCSCSCSSHPHPHP